MSQAATTLTSTWLSDEAILGIEPDTTAPSSSSDSALDSLGETDGQAATNRGGANRAADVDANASGATQDADRAASDTGHESRATEHDSQPANGGKRDTSVTIHALPAATLEQLDAAYYSPEPAARAQFAQTLFASDPAAFRAMFNEAARLLGVPVGQAFLPAQSPGPEEERRAEASSAPTTAKTNRPPAPDANGATQNDFTTANGSPHVAPGLSPASPTFPAQQYRAFEAATNDALSREVRGAIGSTLDQVLPGGTSAGAARRIADDIYTDIGKQLAADVQLSSQIGEVLRGWQFGSGEQQQVSTLLTARARQLLPSAARKVIGEWSTNVLATARTRAARSEASASRVDVGNAASRPAASSEPARALKPKEIDYARTSDDDILAM
jgi:hypothetical protein